MEEVLSNGGPPTARVFINRRLYRCPRINSDEEWRLMTYLTRRAEPKQVKRTYFSTLLTLFCIYACMCVYITQYRHRKRRGRHFYHVVFTVASVRISFPRSLFLRWIPCSCTVFVSSGTLHNGFRVVYPS